VTYERRSGAEFWSAAPSDVGRGMDPRVKPEDDEGAVVAVEKP